MSNNANLRSPRNAPIKSVALSRHDELSIRIIEYGILGIIIFSPLPAGSVHEWSILLIQLTVLIMTAAFLVMEGRPEINKYLDLKLVYPKLFFLGLFVFLIFQILPLPVFLVKIISPNSVNFQNQFSVEFSSRNFTSLSLIPFHSLRKGLEFLSYFLLAFLIIKTVTTKRQIIRLYTVLIGLGIFEAFYGLFELYSKNPRILFYKKIYSINSVSGTFVSRNHFSGYVEMIIPIAIGLFISRMNLFTTGGMKVKERFLRLSEKGLAINLLLFFGIIMMSISIVFSKSRSGVFLLLFTLILFASLTTLFFGWATRQKKWMRNFLVVSVLIIVFISLYTGIGAVIERFSVDNVLRVKRPMIWRNTIEISKDYPLFGTGFGTFSQVYLDESKGEIPVHVYHAHNDYLEYLSELGIIGMSLLMGGIFVVFLSTFKIWRQRRNVEIKSLTLGGIIGVVNILLHSLTDFNLQIPANMILFSVVISLTFVTATYKYKSPDHKKRNSFSRNQKLKFQHHNKTDQK